MNFLNIDPVIFKIGPFAVHWYGVMYLIAFLLFYFLANHRINRRSIHNFSKKNLEDFLFYGIWGVIVGGRLGYVIFYQPQYFFYDPLKIFYVWEGGMSFHGGLIGVVFAVYLFSKKIKIKFLELSDFIAPMVPLGLFFGRIGNFINAELWGRTTEISWGVVFENVDNLTRHPSQIYQAFTEGLILFVLLWLFSSKKRKTGLTSSLFLILYGSFRFLTEFFREPDYFLGFIFFNLTMGQILCFIMILAGFLLFYFSFGKPNTSKLKKARKNTG